MVPSAKLSHGDMKAPGDASQRIATHDAVNPDAVAHFRASSARMLRRNITAGINLQRSPRKNLRTPQMVPLAEAFDADMEATGNGAQRVAVTDAITVIPATPVERFPTRRQRDNNVRAGFRIVMRIKMICLGQSGLRNTIFLRDFRKRLPFFHPDSPPPHSFRWRNLRNPRFIQVPRPVGQV